MLHFISSVNNTKICIFILYWMWYFQTVTRKQLNDLLTVVSATWNLLVSLVRKGTIGAIVKTDLLLHLQSSIGLFFIISYFGESVRFEKHMVTFWKYSCLTFIYTHGPIQNINGTSAVDVSFFVAVHISNLWLSLFKEISYVCK